MPRKSAETPKSEAAKAKARKKARAEAYARKKAEAKVWAEDHPNGEPMPKRPTGRPPRPTLPGSGVQPQPKPDPSSDSASPTSPKEQITLAPQKGPQQAFLQTSADIAIYGGGAGGGKSWALLMEPLRHVANPKFGAVIFRRTSPQITNEGGLWDESSAIYPLLKAVPSLASLDWRFPSGANIGMRHLQHETNVYDWQGSQVPLIEFDELTHFTEAQFWYLLSRNRSTCGVRPYVRASCNSDATSWVKQVFAPWLDKASRIKAESGEILWFVRMGGEIVWSKTKEELTRLYPETPAKSATFVHASVYDNKILLEKDPGYLANLMALPFVERERLLNCNWDVVASGNIFKREWYPVVHALPSHCQMIRYWDKAGTEGGTGCFTAGVLMARSNEGRYYVVDVIRGRWSAGQREAIIKQTAHIDGHNVDVWVEREPGSGGKESAENTIINLQGFSAWADQVTGDKVTRAMPFAAQSEVGNVSIVDAPWNKAYLDELAGFPNGFKDQVDASSGAFNKLAAQASSSVVFMPNPLQDVRWGA